MQRRHPRNGNTRSTGAPLVEQPPCLVQPVDAEIGLQQRELDQVVLRAAAADETAFPHRGDTLFCIQYGSTWTSPSDTPQRLDEMRQCYAAMRPYVSGAAYVNYCDLDLTDYASAYWGQNLPRLKQIKSAFDPNNIFKHAQSVPLA